MCYRQPILLAAMIVAQKVWDDCNCNCIKTARKGNDPHTEPHWGRSHQGAIAQVWDDKSLLNVDFSLICSAYSLQVCTSPRTITARLLR